MRSRWTVVAALVVGFVCGAAMISVVDRSDGSPASSAETGPTVPPRAVATTVPDRPAEASSTPVATPAIIDGDVLLAWTAGGLAPGFADVVAGLAAAERVSVVRGEEIGLTEVRDADDTVLAAWSDGWSVPSDVIAIDPAVHEAFVDPDDASLVAGLEAGEGLLSRTAAEQRGGGVGLRLSFGTDVVEVVGIIDDQSGSGAELVVDVATGEALGIATDRFLLIGFARDRDGLQQAVVGALDGLDAAEPVRFRTRAETTWLRHGDAVLPLAEVKRRFGEFAVRDRSGRDVEIDPAWVADNIVTTDVPILGPVRCHRTIAPVVATVMGDLVDRGLEHLVDAADFAGCFSARRIGPGLALSRHAWGIALDLNVDGNPRGRFDTQDDRLTAGMESAGFGWGGRWLVPDPAHYEAIAIG